MMKSHTRHTHRTPNEITGLAAATSAPQDGLFPVARPDGPRAQAEARWRGGRNAGHAPPLVCVWCGTTVAFSVPPTLGCCDFCGAPCCSRDHQVAHQEVCLLQHTPPPTPPRVAARRLSSLRQRPLHRPDRRLDASPPGQQLPATEFTGVSFWDPLGLDPVAPPPLLPQLRMDLATPGSAAEAAKELSATVSLLAEASQWKPVGWS